MNFTKKDFVSELTREIKVRETVYPRWVADRKLAQTDADQRIAVLRALLEHVRDCPSVPGADTQKRLF